MRKIAALATLALALLCGPAEPQQPLTASVLGQVQMPAQTVLGNSLSVPAGLNAIPFAQFVPRQRLTGPTTFFVDNGSGSDGNTCLTITSGACATIQGALLRIYQQFDANGQAITISCAPGQTYTGAVTLVGALANPGGTPITLNCNNSTLNVTNNNAISVNLGAYLQLQNIVLKTTTSGNCLEAFAGGKFVLGGGINFNGCAGFDIEAGDQSYINVIANYTISGNSVGHLHLTDQSLYTASALATITTSGTPAWSGWFVGVCCGAGAEFFNITFAGTGGTGQHYLVHEAAHINTGVNPATTNPETFLPGSTIGVVDASSSFLPYKSPAAPTSCGTGSPAMSGGATDWSGYFLEGTGATGCTMTFNAAKTTAPNCTVTPASALTSFAYSVSGSAITVTHGAASGTTIAYVCVSTGL